MVEATSKDAAKKAYQCQVGSSQDKAAVAYLVLVRNHIASFFRHAVLKQHMLDEPPPIKLVSS